jgi:hypothetical protein
LLLQSFQLGLDPFQVSSDMAVMFSLFRILGNDKSPSACTLSLQFLGIFRADEAAEADYKTLEGRHIQLVPPPEGVEDLGPAWIVSSEKYAWLYS